jgi:hypothetical protein
MHEHIANIPWLPVILLLVFQLLLNAGIVTAVLASLSLSREAANKAVDFIELLLSHKLPVELVDSTEALLVRLQAVTRLANLLCPPFPCKDGFVHKKGRK